MVGISLLLDAGYDIIVNLLLHFRKLCHSGPPRFLSQTPRYIFSDYNTDFLGLQTSVPYFAFLFHESQLEIPSFFLNIT